MLRLESNPPFSQHLFLLAATMTAALCSTGALTSLLPLGSVTSLPAPVEVHPNIGLALEEVRRKLSQKANNMSIKEFTDVRALV